MWLKLLRRNFWYSAWKVCLPVAFWVITGHTPLWCYEIYAIFAYSLEHRSPVNVFAFREEIVRVVLWYLHPLRGVVRQPILQKERVALRNKNTTNREQLRFRGTTFFHGKLYTVKYDDSNILRPRNVCESRAQILSEEALGMEIKSEREQFSDYQRFKWGKTTCWKYFGDNRQLYFNWF